LPKGRVGPYQLQAAIAAVHDEAATAGETDWPQILALYGVLARLSDNPMVALNQAIATAMVDGPAAGLKRLDEVAADPRLAATTAWTPCAASPGKGGDLAARSPATGARPSGRPASPSETIC
jgi:predicted RNA polymerase sigma factor